MLLTERYQRGPPAVPLLPSQFVHGTLRYSPSKRQRPRPVLASLYPPGFGCGIWCVSTHRRLGFYGTDAEPFPPRDHTRHSPGQGSTLRKGHDHHKSSSDFEAHIRPRLPAALEHALDLIPKIYLSETSSSLMEDSLVLSRRLLPTGVRAAPNDRMAVGAIFVGSSYWIYFNGHP